MSSVHRSTRPAVAPSAAAEKARGAYAQAFAEYEAAFKGRFFKPGAFGPGGVELTADELKITDGVTAAAAELLTAEGVAFERVEGGLRISPGTQTPLNRAAQRAAADGVQVLLSPASTMRDMSGGKHEPGAATVFIGPAALTERPIGATVNHELGHQRGWARMLRGEADLFFVQSRSLNGYEMLGNGRFPAYAQYLQMDEVPQFLRDSLFHAVKLRQSTSPEDAEQATGKLLESLANASQAVKQQNFLFGAVKQALAEQSPHVRVDFVATEAGLSGRAVLGNTQIMLPMTGSFADAEATPEKVAAFRREIDVRMAMLEELQAGIGLAGGGIKIDNVGPLQTHRDVVDATRKLYAMHREGRAFLVRAAEAQSASPDALWR